jgi:cysteine dioxygenase
MEEVLRYLREEVHGAEGTLKVGRRLEGVRVRSESLGPFLHFKRGRYTRNLSVFGRPVEARPGGELTERL